MGLSSPARFSTPSIQKKRPTIHSNAVDGAKLCICGHARTCIHSFIQQTESPPPPRTENVHTRSAYMSAFQLFTTVFVHMSVHHTMRLIFSITYHSSIAFRSHSSRYIHPCRVRNHARTERSHQHHRHSHRHYLYREREQRVEPPTRHWTRLIRAYVRRTDRYRLSIGADSLCLHRQMSYSKTSNKETERERSYSKSSNKETEREELFKIQQQRDRERGLIQKPATKTEREELFKNQQFNVKQKERER